MDMERTLSHAGSRLGLAIAARVVGLYGGELALFDREGSGTIDRLTLPLLT